MEINFSNVTYKDIKNLSFKIEENSIIAISGDATKEMIADLIVGFIKPEFGSVLINDFLLTKNTLQKDIREIQKQIGYVFEDPSKYLKNLTVKNEIMLNLKLLKENNKLSKCLKVLDLVGLDNSYLSKKSLLLSSAEQYKVMLASILVISPKILILNQTDYYLSYKEQEELKKILKKLHITVLIISNNTNFYFDIVDKILITSNYKLKIMGDKNILYDKKVSNYIDIPPIIKFISKCHKNNHRIKKYDDINELMKEIYRNVNEK